MRNETKQRLILALLNASEMIRSHAEIGLYPEDVNEEDDKGLYEHVKACEKASKMIKKIADKYNK